jgi:hypothetical protein
MKMKFTPLFIIIALLFIGCTFSLNSSKTNDIEDIMDANEVTNSYYDYQKTNSLEEMIALFSVDYIHQTGKENLIKKLKNYELTLGALKEGYVVKSESKIVHGFPSSSSNYSIEYTNKYEKHNTVETFKLTKGFLGKVKIIDFTMKIK